MCFYSFCYKNKNSSNGRSPISFMCVLSDVIFYLRHPLNTFREVSRLSLLVKVSRSSSFESPYSIFPILNCTSSSPYPCKVLHSFPVFVVSFLHFYHVAWFFLENLRPVSPQGLRYCPLYKSLVSYQTFQSSPFRSSDFTSRGDKSLWVSLYPPWNRRHLLWLSKFKLFLFNHTNFNQEFI